MNQRRLLKLVLLLMSVLLVGCATPTPIIVVVTATPTPPPPTPIVIVVTATLLPPTAVPIRPTATDVPLRPPATDSPTRTPLPPPPTPQTYFRLINRHSQKCLTARGINQEVVHATCGYGDDQLWYVPAGDSQVSLESKSGVCVAYNPNNTSNALFGVRCSGPRPWTIDLFDTFYRIGTISIKLPHPHATQVPLETGMYFQLRYAGDCVDVEGWNHNEGQRIIHTQCRNCKEGFDDDNQLWARYP